MNDWKKLKAKFIIKAKIKYATKLTLDKPIVSCFVTIKEKLPRHISYQTNANTVPQIMIRLSTHVSS